MNYTPYKPKQADTIFRYVHFRPEWLIDCGPGFGQEALSFKARWSHIKVVGLEPSRKTRLLIKDTYPGMLLGLAAWSTCELDRPLHYHETEMGATLTPLTESGAPIKVDCVSLDRLDDWLGPIENAVLWADVEMSEEYVVRGAAGLLLSGGIRLMNLETHDGDMEKSLDELCDSMGFDKIHSYEHSGYHHDNLYRRRES
jgi:hypothetical protein